MLALPSSGLRVGVLVSGSSTDLGADALRLKDLPDLNLATGRFSAKPPMVVVQRRLSKNKRAYVTFVSTEAAETIETYPGERLRSGERLAPRTPLVTPGTKGVEGDRRTSEGFLVLNGHALDDTLADMLSKIAPKWIRWTMHLLRAPWITQLELGESQGFV